MSKITDSNSSDQFYNTTVTLRDANNENFGTEQNRIYVDTKLTKDSGHVDTSGRIRTALPIELMSYYFSNTSHSLKMNTAVNAGTGTVALTLNKGSVTITNTLGAADKINFSTKKYARHTPGQTHRTTIAGRIGLPKANVEKRWGMFTEFNGFFFKQTASGLSVVIRDGGAGDPVVETEIAQANWNRDKLDGTGASLFNLNPDHSGIWVVEWDWHGSGVIKFGIVYEHEVLYCHEFEFDFVQTDTSIRSPSLPINIEIKNTGIAASNTSILISAVSLYKDGEREIKSEYSFSASRNVNSATVGNGAERPLIALRPKSNFNGILARIGIVPSEVSITSLSHPIYVRVVLNPTTITGASWTSANSQSNAEFDVSATSITGGITIWEGYVAAGTSLLGGDVPGVRDGLLGLWELNFNYPGTIPDSLVVLGRSLVNNTSSFAAIRWLEFQ